MRSRPWLVPEFWNEADPCQHWEQWGAFHDWVKSRMREEAEEEYENADLWLKIAFSDEVELAYQARDAYRERVRKMLKSIDDLDGAKHDYEYELKEGSGASMEFTRGTLRLAEHICKARRKAVEEE